MSNFSEFALIHRFLWYQTSLSQSLSATLHMKPVGRLDSCNVFFLLGFSEVLPQASVSLLLSFWVHAYLCVCVCMYIDAHICNMCLCLFVYTKPAVRNAIHFSSKMIKRNCHNESYIVWEETTLQEPEFHVSVSYILSQPFQLQIWNVPC